MILLRKAKEVDIQIITDLAERIWPQTYSDYITEQQLRYMLDLMYSKTELLSQLQKGYNFIIANDGKEDVGFACSSLIEPETATYKLHKLYVLPEMHGKGVGKILINEVKNLAVGGGGKFLQLNVNRNNKAADFYKKIGFKIKETVDVNIGNGFFMNDYVMEIEIS